MMLEPIGGIVASEVVSLRLFTVALNILGGVVGFDIRRSAIKLPGLGRPSMPPPA